MNMEKLFYAIIALTLAALQSCASVSIVQEECDKFVTSPTTPSDCKVLLTDCAKFNIAMLIAEYYQEYFAVPTTIQLLENNFIDVKSSKKFADFFRKNSECFRIGFDGWYVNVKYKNEYVLQYPADNASYRLWPLTWEDISLYYDLEAEENLNQIWAYKDGVYQKMDTIQGAKFAQMLDSCADMALKENCNYVSYQNVEGNRVLLRKKLVLLYQYEVSDGLSLHAISLQKFTMENNSYSKHLEALLKQLCEDYDLTKVVFTAYAMK